jgi:hypothetical protein
LRLAILLLALCLPAPAKAAPIVRVTVFLLPAPGFTPKVVMRVHNALTKALAQDPRLDLKDSDKLLVEFAGETPRDRIDQAKTAMTEGNALLKEGKPIEAVPRLTEAVAAYEEVLAFVKKEQLARAMLALGVAHAASRQPKRALAVFQGLLTWRPRFAYDPDTYDPAHLPLFERARAIASKSKRGSVELVTDPPGAQAYVDGKKEGETPIVVFGLPVGAHYATYKRQGYIKAAQKVIVSPTEQTRFTLSLRQSDKYLILKQSIEASRAALGQAQASADMVSLRSVLFVDQVVFATLGYVDAGRVSVQAYLYDLRSKQRLNYVVKTVELQRLGAELAELGQNLYLNARLDGALEAPPEAPPPPPPKRSRFYATWWFWSAIAVGAAAIAVGSWQIADKVGKVDTCPPGYSCVSYGN